MNGDVVAGEDRRLVALVRLARVLDPLAQDRFEVLKALANLDDDAWEDMAYEDQVALLVCAGTVSDTWVVRLGASRKPVLPKVKLVLDELCPEWRAASQLALAG